VDHGDETQNGRIKAASKTALFKRAGRWKRMEKWLWQSIGDRFAFFGSQECQVEILAKK
jgi:hypothetical protein